MLHVEVWLGDGPKTIGARWNNGKVQVFDSYKFNPKSFTNEKYLFRSIDTWLMGICKRSEEFKLAHNRKVVHPFYQQGHSGWENTEKEPIIANSPNTNSF